MKKVMLKIGCSVAILSFFCNTKANAQVIYFDPVVSSAMIGVNTALANGQKKQEKELNKLQKAQLWVGGQLAWANDIQNNILKGLSEVNAAVTTGIQAKNIVYETKMIWENFDKLKKFIAQNPEYAVFGKKATESLYQDIILLGTHVVNVKTGGWNNLMSSGDRYKSLEEIRTRLKTIRIRINAIYMVMERAKYVGFWKSINPFQGYINTDKNIVENIIWKYNVFL